MRDGETYAGRPVKTFDTVAEAELATGEQSNDLADRLYGSGRLAKGSPEAREHMAKIRKKRSKAKRKKQTKTEAKVDGADETKAGDKGSDD